MKIVGSRGLKGVLTAFVYATVFSVLLWPSKALGGPSPKPRTWFVSFSGSDNTPCATGGTSASAFLTIATAYGCALAGDTISIDGTLANGLFEYIQPSTLTIAKKLTIVGTGTQPLISGGGLIQVLHNVVGNTLIIRSVTIDGGGQQIGGVTTGGTLTGGGIFNEGTLTLSEVTLTLNTAGHGGGIYNTGSLTATNTTISNNKATGLLGDHCDVTGLGISSDGGGIYSAGSMTLSHVTISNNTAINDGCARGGGIENRGSMSLTSGSLVFRNRVQAGLAGC